MNRVSPKWTVGELEHFQTSRTSSMEDRAVRGPSRRI